MKSKAIFMALLALAFGAQAVPVSRQDVAAAAQAWARSGTTMGQPIADAIAETREFAVTNGQSFFALKMKDGKTIVMSSDTEFDPVIAFSADPNLNLGPDSPLVKILRQDIIIRTQNKAGNVVAARLTGALPGSAPTAAAAASKWSVLLGTSQGGASSGSVAVRQTAGAGGCAEPVKSVDDVRVAPMVKSKWSQSSTGGGYCYNYYTPNHYYCGCTATAASQIMRYFCFPTASMPSRPYTCKVDGKTQTLTTIGGVYDWEKMTYVNPSTEESREAIGHLTYDVGVAFGSSYASGATGASGEEAAHVFKGPSFGYKSAFVYGGTWTWLDTGAEAFPLSSEESLHNEEVRKLVIYANLDAKRPVQLGIFGEQPGMGHSVVGDGYGFKDVKGVKTSFVHINMGWAGTDDVWYNLPEVDAKQSGATAGGGAMDFTKLMTCTFNISPDSTGEIVSGRTTDEDGKPMAGVVVTAFAGGTQVAETTSDEHGIYAFSLTANKTYTLKFLSSDATYAADDITVAVGKTTSGAVSRGENFDIVWGRTKIGNRWGNDVVMREVVFNDSVRNVDTGTLYGTLDAALAEAGAGDTLEILSITLLRTAQTIDKSITIRTAAGVSPADAPVTCRTAAMHGFTSVTNGATLALENVAFANTEGCFVYVHSNAFLSVSGTVGLTDGSYVHTEDERGIKLAGELTSYLTVDCRVATALGQQFGTCSDEAFAVSASHFLNPHDEDLGGEVSGSKLVWSRVPVDPALAVAYFTGDQGENKQYYRKISTLFDDHQEDSGDVVVLKDCELKLPAIVKGTKRLVCTNESGAATITFNASTNATFYVEADAALSVSNLVFTGAVRDGAFVVRGGELTLDADTLITGCGDPDANVKGETFSCAVTVRYDDDWVTAGKLTMLEGSVISNCTTVGFGGGVYVAESLGTEPCELNLFGGKVVNCSSINLGGGVYAGGGSVVRIKGGSSVTGCYSDTASTSSKGGPDNLYVCWYTHLELTDELTGRVNLRVPFASEIDDGAFGFIAEACGEAAASNSAVCFFNDDNPELHGAVGFDEDEGRVLVWSDEPLPTPPPEFPVARVIYTNDVPYVTNEFATVHEAFDSIRDDAIVEITSYRFPTDPALKIEDDEEIRRLTNSIPYLMSFVTIKHDVLLRTEETPDGFANAIYLCTEGHDSSKAAFTVAKGGKLTLSNIGLEGRYPGFVITLPPPEEPPEDEPTEKLLAADDDPLEGMKISFDDWFVGDNKTLVCVEEGGELVMEDGATVAHVTGSASRDSVGISVCNGNLTMLEGSSVTDCTCTYKSENDEQSAPAGGVIVEGPKGLFVLDGGRVSQCGGVLGGGVYVATGARIEISGASEIAENYLLSGSKFTTTNANLSVGNEAAVDGHLVLAGEFTGGVGVLEPRLYNAFSDEMEVETNVFGTVAENISDLASLVPSAARFTRDASGATGLIATNDEEVILVWSSAVVRDEATGKLCYDIKDGYGLVIDRYVVIENSAVPTVITNTPTPIAFREIARVSETEWKLVVTDLVEKCEYALSFTDDLGKPFATGEWFRATFSGPLTTNVLFSSEAVKPAYFWRAHGRETYDKKED